MREEPGSLLPKADFTRREFVVTSLAAGFALAVQPVSAQTITTDTRGLDAGEVKITVKDGTIPGYRAMPDHGGPFPGYQKNREPMLRVMRKHRAALKDIDVAFVCMNLPYTMPPDEAAEAVKAFKPKVVYPYHYRGSKTEEFAAALKNAAGIEVRLRKLEGEQ